MDGEREAAAYLERQVVEGAVYLPELSRLCVPEAALSLEACLEE